MPLRSIARRLLARVALSALLLHASPATARFVEPFQFAPNAGSMGVSASPVRGALKLATTAPDGLPLHGLSALAWSSREHVLYALSDFGYMVVLQPRFDGGTLVDLRFLARIPLRDADGAPLQGRDRDAEGLALQRMPDGRETLLVSFEQRPRVTRFELDGAFIGALPLPKRLAQRLGLSAPNQGLEGLAWTPGWGTVVSVETALARAPQRLEIHALRGNSRWRFAAAEPGGALVALETLPQRRLMLLERRYRPPLAPLVISLRLLELDQQEPTPRVLARFSSAEGWPVDNFEGLARHRAAHYFLLSDDNASPLQSTLLLYLELPIADSP